ncbi:universal stress protein [Methyloceanibacter sp.]|uniref:universal stress protein n=1 Tax=Methyloceanibacter sp. TaxID=1965321 RepID=UPI003D6D2BBC
MQKLSERRSRFSTSRRAGRLAPQGGRRGHAPGRGARGQYRGSRTTSTERIGGHSPIGRSSLRHGACERCCPYKAILDTASAKGCDLIVMGSHGRRGMAALLLGSETQKTLTHGKIPVLVYRE